MGEIPWGKINGGQSYQIITTDLDRAIGCAMLTWYESVVLQHIRETTWGGYKGGGKIGTWPDAKPYRFRAKRLANRTGLIRQRLQGAKDSLVRSNILKADDNDNIMINKNANEWIFPGTGKPRLTPELLAYCTESQPKSEQSDSERENVPENAKTFSSEGVDENAKTFSRERENVLLQTSERTPKRSQENAKTFSKSARSTKERARVLRVSKSELKREGEETPASGRTRARTPATPPQISLSPAQKLGRKHDQEYNDMMTNGLARTKEVMAQILAEEQERNR